MALVLIIGGARSGKSEAAIRLAAAQRAPVVFIATAEPGDPEMEARIRAHRGERPDVWTTVEEPLDLVGALAEASEGDCVILDCLTVWTANALEALGAAETEARASAACGRASMRKGTTIAVTNEVGMGVVPDNPLGRSYRDLLGRVNAIWAQAAERTFLMVAGRALVLGDLESTFGTAG
jgi:adenosylcobyric acid synthase